jgi:hypothetical protein
MKVQRTALLLVSCVCLAVTIHSQTAPKPAAPRYTLSFDTGVVLKSGDVKFVAREDFYLLKRDLTDILRDANWDKGGVDEFGINYKLEKTSPSRCKTDPPARAVQSISKSAVASTTTDFNGKGRLTAPAGTYYLFGVGMVGDNIVTWNAKINLSGDQSIVLDNRNSAAIRGGGDLVAQVAELTRGEREARPEYFGKLQLGPSVSVRGMAIPCPICANTHVTKATDDGADLISIELTASEADLRNFYAGALPRYKWMAEGTANCWTQQNPISNNNERLCQKDVRRLRVSDDPWS